MLCLSQAHARCSRDRGASNQNENSAHKHQTMAPARLQLTSVAVLGLREALATL